MANSTLTPGIIESFADAIRRGIPISTACRILDVPERSFQQWLSDANMDQRHNGSRISTQQKTSALALVTAIKRAQAEAEAEAVERLRNWRSSKTGDDDWRQHAWFLTHGPARQNWFEHKQSHQTIDVQHHPAHTQVRELETTELLALIEPDTSENV